MDDIQGTARKMLSSTNLDILHQIPANDNNSTIPSNLVTIARRDDKKRDGILILGPWNVTFAKIL